MRAVLAGFAVLLAAPQANAALNVFGSTLARECYQAAIAGAGTGAALCERALSSEQMSPRDKAATLVNRGIIYNAARQLDLAVADFNAALAINGDLGEAYLNRGNANFLRRKFPEAEQDYSKAIDLKVSNLDYAHYNRALVYEAMKRYDEAKADLNAALAITPGFKPASDRLVVVNQIMSGEVRVQEPVQTPSSTVQPAVNSNQ